MSLMPFYHKLSHPTIIPHSFQVARPPHPSPPQLINTPITKLLFLNGVSLNSSIIFPRYPKTPAHQPLIDQ
ncbi:hypothetical protein BC829DRAFT_395295, partial [Chytridium lagenaria]